MSKKHLVFIINPKSGVERRKEIKGAIEENLDLNAFSYELVETQFAMHGTQLAAEAAKKDAYAVVAVGGDGSVNDIMKGLLGTNTMLAIIPKGSGNGMARTMNIPLDANEAVKVINKQNVVNVDIAFANGIPFISNAGVAFDALISKKFAKSEKRGLAMYSWLVTKHLWTYKVWSWNIEIDGREMKEKAFMINVANGQQFGYDFKIAPAASYTDGRLDLVIVRKFPKILGGIIALRAMKGNINKSPFVRHFSGTNITISNKGLRLMQTDGDAHPCDSKINFTIQPGAQKVLVP